MNHDYNDLLDLKTWGQNPNDLFTHDSDPRLLRGPLLREQIQSLPMGAPPPTSRVEGGDRNGDSGSESLQLGPRDASLVAIGGGGGSGKNTGKNQKKRKRTPYKEAGLSRSLQRVLRDMGWVVLADALAGMVKEGVLASEDNPLVVERTCDPVQFGSNGNSCGISSIVTFSLGKWLALSRSWSSSSSSSSSQTCNAAAKGIVQERMANLWNTMSQVLPNMLPFSAKTNSGGVGPILDDVRKRWLKLLDQPSALLETLRSTAEWYQKRGFKPPTQGSVSHDDTEIQMGHPCLVPISQQPSDCIRIEATWAMIFSHFTRSVTQRSSTSATTSHSSSTGIRHPSSSPTPSTSSNLPTLLSPSKRQRPLQHHGNHSNRHSPPQSPPQSQQRQQQQQHRQQHQHPQSNGREEETSTETSIDIESLKRKVRLLEFKLREATSDCADAHAALAAANAKILELRKLYEATFSESQ